MKWLETATQYIESSWYGRGVLNKRKHRGMILKLYEKGLVSPRTILESFWISNQKIL